VPGGTGRYQLVGGACAGGEAPHEAAVRHGRAEIGLEMKPDTHLLADYMPPNPQANSVEGTNHVFLHRLQPGEEITLNAGDKSGRLADFQWFTEGDLDGTCFTDYQARRIRRARQAAADPAHRGYSIRGHAI
jgi:ADP-ribose pyrophosphatase YjhB (NUDIX family)